MPLGRGARARFCACASLSAGRRRAIVQGRRRAPVPQRPGRLERGPGLAGHGGRDGRQPGLGRRGRRRLPGFGRRRGRELRPGWPGQPDLPRRLVACAAQRQSGRVWHAGCAAGGPRAGGRRRVAPAGGAGHQRAGLGRRGQRRRPGPDGGRPPPAAAAVPERRRPPGRPAGLGVGPDCRDAQPGLGRCGWRRRFGSGGRQPGRGAAPLPQRRRAAGDGHCLDRARDPPQPQPGLGRCGRRRRPGPGRQRRGGGLALPEQQRRAGAGRGLERGAARRRRRGLGRRQRRRLPRSAGWWDIVPQPARREAGCGRRAPPHRANASSRSCRNQRSDYRHLRLEQRRARRAGRCAGVLLPERAGTLAAGHSGVRRPDRVPPQRPAHLRLGRRGRWADGPQRQRGAAPGRDGCGAEPTQRTG